MKKTSQILSLCLLLAGFSLVGCSPDPTETIVGTWSTADGGTIIFKVDGTGEASDSDDFFEKGCEFPGEVPVPNTFTYTVVDNSGSTPDRLNFAFDGVCVDGSWEDDANPVTLELKFTSKNKMEIGTETLLYDGRLLCTRK